MKMKDRILDQVTKNPSATTQSIASECETTAANVWAHLKRLEDKGFIERQYIPPQRIIRVLKK